MVLSPRLRAVHPAHHLLRWGCHSRATDELANAAEKGRDRKAWGAQWWKFWSDLTSAGFIWKERKPYVIHVLAPLSRIEVWLWEAWEYLAEVWKGNNLRLSISASLPNFQIQLQGLAGESTWKEILGDCISNLAAPLLLLYFMAWSFLHQLLGGLFTASRELYIVPHSRVISPKSPSTYHVIIGMNWCAPFPLWLHPLPVFIHYLRHFTLFGQDLWVEAQSTAALKLKHLALSLNGGNFLNPKTK